MASSDIRILEAFGVEAFGVAWSLSGREVKLLNSISSVLGSA